MYGVPRGAQVRHVWCVVMTCFFHATGLSLEMRSHTFRQCISRRRPAGHLSLKSIRAWLLIPSRGQSACFGGTGGTGATIRVADTDMIGMWEGNRSSFTYTAPCWSSVLPRITASCCSSCFTYILILQLHYYLQQTPVVALVLSILTASYRLYLQPHTAVYVYL